MTEVARDAISNIATGLTIYCTDCGTSGEGVLQVYNASNWEDLNDFVSASTGGMFTEKVGIGTIGTTPIYALDVDAKDKGSSTYSARFTNSAPENDLYNIVLFTQGESGTALGYLGTGGSNVTNPAFKNNFVVGTKNNTPLVLNTNDTERMRITADGKVGIGTTNPSAALVVETKTNDNNEGNVLNSHPIFKAFNNSTSSEGSAYSRGLEIGAPSGNVIGPVYMKTNTGNRLAFLDKDNHENLTILDNGNVGIGTDEPQAMLHVNGSITTDPIYTHPDCKTWKNCISSHVFTSMHYYGKNNTDPIYLGELDNDVFIRGNVGIGTVSASSEKLYVAGDAKITGNVDANNFPGSSDERWKKGIKTLDNSLNKITALRGVSYEWKRDEFPDKNFSEGTQIGVIAQEIESVFPELVHTNKEGYKSVSYSNLVAPLIEAVKELKQQNETLNNRVEALEKEQKNLIERLEALENK
jgi:hypothetical protein